jgi:RNA processing factor Prp31
MEKQSKLRADAMREPSTAMKFQHQLEKEFGKLRTKQAEKRGKQYTGRMEASKGGNNRNSRTSNRIPTKTRQKTNVEWQ